MEKYENLGLVGEGSYGIVMKCRHRATGTLVAIKKFLESEDDKIVKRIANREIKMLRQLRHENLVNLIEVFKRKKKLYLVFEFVDYTLLDDLEKNPTGLEENYGKKTLFQILRGIEFCHNNDVIHRDIKPENILVSKSGIVKLCDFGFARPLSGQLNSFTDYVATRWYRAPELLVGDTKYGRPVDIWAIGCLTSEMFAGDPLFPGDSDIDQLFHIIKCIGTICPKHVEIFHKNDIFKGLKMPESNEKFSLEKRYSRMSKDIIIFIKRCLDPSPEDRPSCSELLNFELFNNDYFTSVFVNEIKMKVSKERDKNPLLKNAFKSGSSLFKQENNNNETMFPKPQVTLKRNSLATKQQKNVNQRLKENECQQSVLISSNQENEMVINNKIPNIDDDTWEDVRPLTSRKERVASRAGRISIIKDAFDIMETACINNEVVKTEGQTLVDIENQKSASKLLTNNVNDSTVKSYIDSSPYVYKTDSHKIFANPSNRNIKTPSHDNGNRSGNSESLGPVLSSDHLVANEGTQSTEESVNRSSPISNDNVIFQNPLNFSINSKKPVLHNINPTTNNNALISSKNQVGNYPTIHQQFGSNPPFNYNSLKQMSTNFAQRPSDNANHSYFPNIGKDSKFRANNFHFPTMSQSNKMFLNTNVGAGMKSQSPMTNERSGLYYNVFNKKKAFTITRSNPVIHQDHNISLPELKGAEIPISRSQPYNPNTKYKYAASKPSFVPSDLLGNASTIDTVNEP